MAWSRISAETAARAMREQGAIYVDVRSVEEFELGHPEGAYNVPWLVDGQPNPAFGGVVAGALGRERPLIVGCQTGQRSGPACAALLAAGFRQVVEQHAGYAGQRDAFGRIVEQGWQRAGLPVAMSALAGRSYRELLEVAAESTAGR